MKRFVNGFLVVANLSKQRTTPVSAANATMQANRPVNAAYHTTADYHKRFISQKELNEIRHEVDVINSRVKRGDREKYTGQIKPCSCGAKGCFGYI